MTADQIQLDAPEPELVSSSAAASHIGRAFKALEALIPGPQTAAAIAAVLGVNRSTALRLRQSSHERGYGYGDTDDRLERGPRRDTPARIRAPQ